LAQNPLSEEAHAQKRVEEMQLIEAGIILAVGLGVSAFFKWLDPREPERFTEDSITLSTERKQMLIEAERHENLP
jgi:hypothetical protein